MRPMAKKLKLMAHFQELRGRAQVTNRRPIPACSGIYLMQLREHTTVTTLPRRRLSITVDLRQSQPVPHPVKIRHVVSPGAAGLPVT